MATRLGGSEMDNFLYMQWIEQEEIDFQRILVHSGVEGILGEFEFWLKQKGYLKD